MTIHQYSLMTHYGHFTCFLTYWILSKWIDPYICWCRPPAVHDRTEDVPDRWRSCLERSSIWRYVCSVAGRLWTALEYRTFSPLLQCCL